VFGIWRSRWHYADPSKPLPDFVADTERELWSIRDYVPAAGTGSAHPVVAELASTGRWRYLGWWRPDDRWTELDKRKDPHIYDAVRYSGKPWSGGPPPAPHIHADFTTYISRH
jgi:hypothetical protein